MLLKSELNYYAGWVVGGWVSGGWSYKTKIILISTQIEVVVEVEVELGITQNKTK